MKMEKVDFNVPGMPEKNEQRSPAELHIALGKIRADGFNDIQGDFVGYDCPKCKNKGVVASVRADGSMKMSPCSCVPVRNYIHRMAASGMHDVLQRFTFETYQDVDEWQKNLKQRVRKYADDPQGWLLVAGQSGCGKTHLCAAVCNVLLQQGKNVVYMPWREEVEKLKNYSEGRESRTQLKERFMNAPILFIDDLYKCGRSADGTCMPSGAEIGIAFDIINYRWAKHLPTIITTERSSGELVAIDEATGSRIAERANGNRLYIAKKPGRNYRLRNEVNI